MSAVSPTPRTAPRRRWQIALNIAVPAVLTLITALAVLELGLRIFYRMIPLDVCASDPIMGYYVCQPYFVYDKPIRIAYRYKPGFRMEGWWDPAQPALANAEDETAPSARDDTFWYTFEVDDMGFPNPEPAWQERYDVVITGDSFVTRSAPQTWIELLEAQTGMDALVLGASSWSTLNEIEAVKLYGLDRAPQWVLVMFFERNDLFNTAQYIERQASGLSWKEFDMRSVPWHRRLVTVHMVRYWLEARTPEPAAPPRYRYPVTASTEAGEIDLVLKDIHLLPMSADYDTLARSDEFARVKEGLVELDAACTEAGARLVLVYVPSKEHVYWSRIWDPVDVDHILERTVTVTLSEGDHGALQWNPPYLSFDAFYSNHNAQELLFEDMAHEAGIAFLNLTPVFWEEAIAQGELYNYGDPHWNQAGNQLAADAIEAYLEAQAP